MEGFRRLGGTLEVSRLSSLSLHMSFISHKHIKRHIRIDLPVKISCGGNLYHCMPSESFLEVVRDILGWEEDIQAPIAKLPTVPHQR